MQADLYNLWNRIKSGISDIVKSRTFIAIIMFCVLSAVLLQRVFYLQIVKGQNYTDKYELQIQKTKEVEGTRGNIYDRNGVLLAYNELAYSVTIQDNGDYDKKSEKNKALNQIVTKVINIVESNGDSVINDFGIILDANSEYSFVAESDTQRLRFIGAVRGDLHRKAPLPTPFYLWHYTIPARQNQSAIGSPPKFCRNRLTRKLGCVIMMTRKLGRGGSFMERGNSGDQPQRASEPGSGRTGSVGTGRQSCGPGRRGRVLPRLGPVCPGRPYGAARPLGHLFQYSRYARAGEVLKAEAEDRSRPHGLIPCHVPALSGLFYPAADGGGGMKAELKLQNRLKEARCEKELSQSQLAELVGVSRNTISSIETGQFNPTAKLALILCIALDRKFEDLFYF